MSFVFMPRRISAKLLIFPDFFETFSSFCCENSTSEIGALLQADIVALTTVQVTLTDATRPSF